MLPSQGDRDFTGPSCEAERSDGGLPCSVDLVLHVLVGGLPIICRLDFDQVLLPNEGEVLLPQKAGGWRAPAGVTLC